MFESCCSLLSAEFLLKKNPNGGGIILLRSTLVSLWIYFISIGILSYTRKGAEFTFSMPQLLNEFNATIPWLGAIFASSYLALYARYSNQWSYLASTYNQLMAAMVHSPQLNSPALIRWQAGFISDAYTLHLDRKPLFKGVVDEFLKVKEVQDLVNSNFEGEELSEFKRRHPFPNIKRIPTQNKTSGSFTRMLIGLGPLSFRLQTKNLK